jgi:hypothetical protein
MTISISPTAPWYTVYPSYLEIAPTLAYSGTTATVTVTLTDGFDPTTYTMTVTAVPNTPPTFISALVDQTVAPGLTKTYRLPSYHDVDSDPVTISLSNLGGNTFVTYSTGVITMSPFIKQVVMSFTLTV